MGNLINTDNAYKEWISDISLRFKQSQIKASMKVNGEMLRFYWSLGHDMDEKKNIYHWGSNFYEQVGKDLRKKLPDVNINLNEIRENDLYIKFSFRYCFDLKQLPNQTYGEQQIIYVKRSSDDFIYISCNQAVTLDDVSFHFS